MLADRVRMGSPEKKLVGQQEFTTSGTHYFTVPDDVTLLSAVCIGGGGGGEYSRGGICGASGGGGGLAYNSFVVTPGEILVVEVGDGGSAGASSVRATGGGRSVIRRGSTILVGAYGGNGAPTGTTSASGGTLLANSFGSPGKSGSNPYRYQSYLYAGGGGGGAGGYSTNTGGGIGGRGGTYTYTSTYVYKVARPGSGGGGTGILGAIGSNGSNGSDGAILGNATTSQSTVGIGAYGGGNGTTTIGGSYGGGGAGGGSTYATDPRDPEWNSTTNTPAGRGQTGAVRIIWGEGRYYPSTRTQNE